MRTLWLFRSNIKELEYYHEYKNLKVFERKCHDFYLLFPLWLLRNDYFDKVIIWRLSDKVHSDITFDINGKKYIQRWVRSLVKVFKEPPPTVSLWRGGFREYDAITKTDHNLGIKMYLGTGKRTYPQYGGIYDVIFQEDKKDFNNKFLCMPFYKTASPYIFYEKKECEKIWDICWPCNFSQISQKGQEEFIKVISNSSDDRFQKLKIVHCGNKPKVGKKLCEKYDVTNIEFMGWQTRNELCDVLNRSKFGLCMSNRKDGCPRIATEILMTKTPMIISEKTRLLNIYKKRGVVDVNIENIEYRILWALEHYEDFKKEVVYAIDETLSFEKICQKNINRWKEELKI